MSPRLWLDRHELCSVAIILRAAKTLSLAEDETRVFETRAATE